MHAIHMKTALAPRKKKPLEQDQAQEAQPKRSIFSHSFFLLFSIFCLAFLVRLLYNLTVARNYYPIYDAGVYEAIARNLLTKHCYCFHDYHATVSRAPLLPWIITAIYFFIGQHSSFVRLFYCVLGSGTCVLVTLFARDLFGKRIAFVTGVIAAIYTGLFLYDGWLYSESLYTFCFTGFIYALFRLQRLTLPAQSSEKNKWQALWQWRLPAEGTWWLVLGGLLLAAATLTRPNGSSLLVVLALWSALLVLLKIKLWPFVAKNFVLITCIAVVLVAPWTYRNYRESHTFVLVSTGMGEVMLGSYNDRTLYGDQSFRGDWMPPLGSKIHDEVGYTSANDKRQAARALAWIRAHLGSMPYLLSLHFLHVWKPYSYSYGLPMEEYPTRLSSRIVQHLIPLMTYAVYLLAFLGLVGTWKRWKKELIGVYLAIALTTLTSVVAYGTSRFRSPIEPFLVLLAGGALWCCTRWMHKYLPANLWAMLPFFKQKSLE